MRVCCAHYSRYCRPRACIAAIEVHLQATRKTRKYRMDLELNFVSAFLKSTLAQSLIILILRMASPWLKRSFILSESHCSGPTAKRRDLEMGANQERDSPAQSPNRERLQPETDLYSPQSGTDVFSISPQTNFQFAHSDLSQGADATMVDSSMNMLQLWNHQNFLSANPQRDVEAPVLSPQPEGEPDLQFSEICFGMV